MWNQKKKKYRSAEGEIYWVMKNCVSPRRKKMPSGTTSKHTWPITLHPQTLHLISHTTPTILFIRYHPDRFFFGTGSHIRNARTILAHPLTAQYSSTRPGCRQHTAWVYPKVNRLNLQSIDQGTNRYYKINLVNRLPPSSPPNPTTSTINTHSTVHKIPTENWIKSVIHTKRISITPALLRLMDNPLRR